MTKTQMRLVVQCCCKLLIHVSCLKTCHNGFDFVFNFLFTSFFQLSSLSWSLDGRQLSLNTDDSYRIYTDNQCVLQRHVRWCSMNGLNPLTGECFAFNDLCEKFETDNTKCMCCPCQFAQICVFLQVQQRTIVCKRAQCSQ